MRLSNLIVCTLLLLAASGCGQDDETNSVIGSQTDARIAAGTVSGQRLANAASDPANWLTHGRTYDEQRYSPLEQINAATVGALDLAWYFDIPTRRGVEATPLIIDGVMYVSGSWSIVYALDAASGKPLWVYDPQVSRAWAKHACCDVVNRGVAAWGNKIFVGTIDGYLVGLNAADGSVAWRVNTIDRDKPYTITGAPRVVKGNVIIGNGGAEFGVRGYVSAYDAETGKQAWRFYTVPGNPDDGFENDALKQAATTWNGEWWKLGGGGTVWDSMAYDPELDLLYIGVGNGSPWNQKIRSPGGGDNLFLSSIVALRPATGEYVWHYQTTPGESWDYTATQHMILADIQIDGEIRKVLMQAPKNGFFYVIDRTDGTLISAANYVPTNWATEIDKSTGRPVEVADARYPEGPRLTFPGPLGGHNWQPMAFSPDTGLVYLPAQEIPWIHADDNNFQPGPGRMNLGTDVLVADFPEDAAGIAAAASMLRGHILAWDPVEQKEVWRYQQPGPWNGGILATAGNLIFQGNLIGEFAAYTADTGAKAWAFASQSGVVAGPVSYAVDGDQYVSVAVGWGSMLSLMGGPTVAPLGLHPRSRVLTFKLGGVAQLPTLPAPEPRAAPQPPEQFATRSTIDKGHAIYVDRCAACHGMSAISGGTLPDLRYASAHTHEIWDAIVLGGAKQDNGMPSFAGILTAKDTSALRAYVIDRAQAELESRQVAAADAG